jgi:Zn-finger domain-containing protein
MNALRPKNDLRYISDVSNLVALIVLRIKEEFKNIDLVSLKKNNELLVFIMELIECGVIQVMFGTLTEEDIKDIDNKIQFILNNKVLRRSNFFFRFVGRCWKRVRGFFVA